MPLARERGCTLQSTLHSDPKTHSPTDGDSKVNHKLSSMSRNPLIVLDGHRLGLADAGSWKAVNIHRTWHPPELHPLVKKWSDYFSHTYD